MSIEWTNGVRGETGLVVPVYKVELRQVIWRAKGVLLPLFVSGILTSSFAHAISTSDQEFLYSLSDTERTAMEVRIAEDEERFLGKRHLLFQKTTRTSKQQNSQTELSGNAGLEAASFFSVGSDINCSHSTIQSAVDAASSGDVISVMNETFQGDAALFNVINKSLTIRGGRVDCNPGSAISGYTKLFGTGMTNPDTIIELTDSAGGMDVILSTFNISSGQDDIDDGGGIEISGKPSATPAQRLDLRLSNVIVHLNVSDNGGGIHMTDGKLTISNESNIASNTAANDGGGVYCLNGEIILSTDSIIGNGPGIFDVGNNAGNYGGGVFLDNCELTLDATDGITGAYIIDNSADRRGGGIYERNTSRINLNGDKAWVHLNKDATRGGGIYAELNSTIYGYNASIKGNSAVVGGGVSLHGASLFLLRSADYPCHGKCNELSENHASNVAGAVDHSGGAVTLDGVWIEGNYAVNRGMIMDTSDTVIVRNSMILNNSYPQDVTGNADELFNVSNGSVTLEYSTVSANITGANSSLIFNMLDAGVSVDIDSCIIWDNENSLYPVGGVAGATFTQSRNITDTGLGSNIGAFFLVPGSNYHIAANAPAVDFGTESLNLLYDIDGEPRGLQETPDAGADEANARVGIGGAVCEYSTIEEAITAAIDSDTIYISGGNYLESAIAIDKSLTFVQANFSCQDEQLNPIPADLVVDGSNLFNSTGGLFNVANGKTVSFKHMTLQNAHANYGGIIYTGTSTSLLLDNVVVKGGTAQQHGGGVRGHGAVRLINGSAISNNFAATIGAPNDAHAQSGGGISLSGSGSLILDGDSLVSDNDAVKSGGGIYTAGTVSVGSLAQVLANTADTGGGIYASTGTNIAIDGELVKNGAEQGAGIYADGASINLAGTARVRENTAEFHGGGLYLRNASNLTMADSAYVESNKADKGAGIYVLTGGPQITIAGGIVRLNTAIISGGGLHVATDLLDGSVSLQTTRYETNRAKTGAGISYDSRQVGGSLVMSDLWVKNNHASISGGGISIWGEQALSVLTFTGFHISLNSAAVNGGGLELRNASDFQINGSWIQSNTAIENGGGVYLTRGAQLSSQNTNFSLNTANKGGGMYLDGTVTGPIVLLENQSIIRSNTADFGGGVYLAGTLGAVAVFTMRDGIMSNNEATSWGGVMLSRTGSAFFERTLFDNNSAGAASIIDGINSVSLIKNSIFHSNTGSTLFKTGADDNLVVRDSTLDAGTVTNAFSSSDASGGVTLSNSILAGFSDSFSGPAILDATCILDSNGELGPMDSALFVNAPGFDYHLQANSPAINKCSSGTISDYESNNRPVSGGATPYDMGAYEYQIPVVSYVLTVSAQGSGTISSSPGGIDCGADCSESYISGTAVTLSASAGPGFVFDSWSGACSGNGSCMVNMAANKNVTATFAAASDAIFSDSFE